MGRDANDIVRQEGPGALRGRLDGAIMAIPATNAVGASRAKPNWHFDLIKGEDDGRPRDCLANGSLILRKDPAFDGRLVFDEHRGRPMCRDMPWDRGSNWREWTNTDDLRLAEWVQLQGVILRPTTCADALQAVTDDLHCHPIREFLGKLQWDGIKRLDRWLADYLSAQPNELTGEFGYRFLISAVARIFKPGCKADCALVLEGKQGAGKSTALASLVPNPEWFADEISDLGSKDAAQDLRGKWIVEIAELSALRRGEIERVKAFMSRSVDHYRPSYGRRSQDFPRQCVFAGTTNADTYLADETGNRRFWPVRVGEIDIPGLVGVRDQLWAEAVTAFHRGEQWWLPAEVDVLAAREQEKRLIVDPWQDLVVEWASKQADDVTIRQILCQLLEVPIERQDQTHQNRVSRILRAAGYERRQVRRDGTRNWVYVKPSPVVTTPHGETGDK